MQKIILRDYHGNPKEVEINEDVEYISGVILSGDMVMEKPYYCDSSNNRVFSFYDGPFHISKENFEKMNSITNSYKIQDLD
jgi:hypothetical protein